MNKTIVQTRFDNLVSSGLWPVLKELGYRRQGNNFRQYFFAEGWGRILNVQKSAFNASDRVQFTLNAGLYLLAAERVNNWGRVSAEQFLEPDCLIRKRIGRLNGTQQDTWYELTPTTPPGVVEQQVLADVQHYVLPYLQRVQSGPELLAQVVRERDPNNADGIRAAFVGGLRQQALAWLNEEIAATIYQYKKAELLRLQAQLLAEEL
ncbi:DUF4304 domain-containing protein [Hymenobacter rigui]|uniref:DUF4304 domain-containing protein n=1 Tax=Hymenobacter rigui TaxID=334424 RepID=A0A3R9NCJ2_9BACT|nr:DUF4304 domain-containing protein [Hymenobacter rigui]RSK44088.1 DUF4304 domain-containing protein [Hymenobacter rigui]